LSPIEVDPENETVGYVEPPADGNALICCSQPKGDIVIDL